MRTTPLICSLEIQNGILVGANSQKIAPYGTVSFCQKHRWNPGESTAEKIEVRIEYNNSGIAELAVKEEQSTAHLSGLAKDRQAMEKSVLIAGNVKGIAEVDASCIQCPQD